MQINPKVTPINLGGKGYQLSRLISICNVPQFFVIAFDNHDEIKDKKAQNQILAAFDKQGFKFVSVRSSATVEDGENASFAGVFESVLNVDRDNLIRAISKVLMSAESERVRDYCALKGSDFGNVEMRVIIQRMVESDISGVCFYNKGQVIIEAVNGLGDKLVGGQVSPASGILSNKQTKEITCLADRIQTKLDFKTGVDIEFAYKDDIPYILQARAVTKSVNPQLLPDIANYEMTFKVHGLGFLFADLLCRGFGYLHPLFICYDSKFEQYFTNEKMKWAADYGVKWLSEPAGFDTYKRKFTAFHKKSFTKLQNLIRSTLPEQFFDILAQYFVLYSKMDFQFTNTTHLYIDKSPALADNLRKLTAFKDVARAWINSVSVNDDCLLNLFLQNLSSDFNVPLQSLNLYKISELTSLLTNVRVPDNLIKDRGSAIVYFDGTDIHYFCGVEAQTMIDDIKRQKASAVSSSVKLKGQTAMRGNSRFVTGRVRLLKVDYESHEEMQAAIANMCDGEILVARFTAPELLSACKKAKAIITDLGGMLSHAAIISRELGIPCLVSTVHATHFFITGDSIKIDLDSGTVEKIHGN